MPQLKVKYTLSILLVLFIFTTTIFYAARHIESKYPKTLVEDMLYLPSGKFLKGAALSYDEMLADMLWIKVIGYYGGRAGTDQNYKWLNHIISIINILDPLFQYPYEFGGVVLATEMQEVDNSIAILKKGMENVPETHERYWYLPFFTAFNYMYYKSDYKTAATYMDIASNSPGSPDYLPLLTARLYANTDADEIAIPFLQEMIRNAKKEEQREQLTQRLYTLVSLRNIRFLESAVNIYITRFSKHPENLEQLVSAGILKDIPPDPLNGKYYIDKDENKVKSTVMPDPLKVHLVKPDRILKDKVTEQK